jgi:hypothetical protein
VHEVDTLGTHRGALRPASHLLQFFDANQDALVQNVATFLYEGIAQGEPCNVLASPATTSALKAALKDRDGSLDFEDKRNFIFFDAQDTLDYFMVDGTPDTARFDQSVGAAVQAMCGSTAAGVRGFGEMVGLLWREGNFSGAIQLERLFNRVLTREKRLRIFCAYPVDIFGSDFAPELVDELLLAHSDLASGVCLAGIEEAVMRATKEAAELPIVPQNMSEIEFRSWATLPRGEAMILRLRTRDPGRAGEILDRARIYYQSHACEHT